MTKQNGYNQLYSQILYDQAKRPKSASYTRIITGVAVPKPLPHVPGRPPAEGAVVPPLEPPGEAGGVEEPAAGAPPQGEGRLPGHHRRQADPAVCRLLPRGHVPPLGGLLHLLPAQALHSVLRRGCGWWRKRRGRGWVRERRGRGWGRERDWLLHRRPPRPPPRPSLRPALSPMPPTGS
jgi:hypothetical protein